MAAGVTATEIAMKMAGPRLDAIRAAAERLKNLHVRNLMDSAEFAVNPPLVLHSNPRGFRNYEVYMRPRSCKSLHVAPPAADFMAYDEWTHLSYEPKPIEVKLADALVAAMSPAPKLTVSLANKLMRDGHKRGDALAFNAAREALRSL